MSYSRPRTSSKYPAQLPLPHGPLVAIHNIPQHGLIPIPTTFSPQHHVSPHQMQLHRGHVQIPRARRHSPRLPPELIAEIVAFIADKPTLAACARVTMAFYQPSQKLFFSEVVLYFKISKQTPRKLHALLKRSPHLIKFIRSIVVHTGSGGAIDDEVAYLHQITPCLSKLESLSFPRYPSNHVSQLTNLPFLPPLTNEQTTNLLKLDISALTDHQFPSLTFFTRLHNVRDLILDPSFSSGSPIAWGLRHNPQSFANVSLKSLSLVGKFTLEQAMTLFGSSAFPFNIDSRLKRLYVDQGDVQWVDLDPYRDLKPLAGLLSVCRDIEQFSFTRCPRSTYFIPTKQVISPFSKLSRPPDLSNAVGMRAITLQGTVEAIANEYPGHGSRRSHLERWIVASPIAWMETLLASIQPGSQVRVRDINLRIDVAHFMTEELIGVMDTQWDGLCNLVTPERFPALQRVRLHIHVSSETARQAAPSLLGRSTALRRLMKHGILRLDLS